MALKKVAPTPSHKAVKAWLEVGFSPRMTDMRNVKAKVNALLTSITAPPETDSGVGYVISATNSKASGYVKAWRV